MPIYEFTCGDCKKDSEILVRSSDWEGHTECPHCGSSDLDKKLSVFAASSSESSISAQEMPPCSGVPSSCGRCGMDN